MKRSSIVGRITSAIVRKFDVSPLHRRCNFKFCKAKPSFALRISIRSLRLNKEVATLYFCSQHVEHARKFAEELNRKLKRVVMEYEIERMQRS